MSSDVAEAPSTPGWGVRVCAGGHVTAVDIRDLKDLLVELDKLAAGSQRLAAAAEVSRRLGSLVGPLDSPSAFEPHGLERLVVLRALDHLRNLGRAGVLMTLRDRILQHAAVEPALFRLRVGGDAPDSAFWSFSLAYESGDRLVRGPAEEYLVSGVEAGEPPLLLVDAWRP